MVMAHHFFILIHIWTFIMLGNELSSNNLYFLKKVRKLKHFRTKMPLNRIFVLFLSKTWKSKLKNIVKLDQRN